MDVSEVNYRLLGMALPCDIKVRRIDIQGVMYYYYCIKMFIIILPPAEMRQKGSV